MARMAAWQRKLTIKVGDVIKAVSVKGYVCTEVMMQLCLCFRCSYGTEKMHRGLAFPELVVTTGEWLN